MVAFSALEWSVPALGDSVKRLADVRESDDAPVAYAAVAEAVWSVTMVDAALVRYYPDAYDLTVAGKSPQERKLIEETLAGLRFVRNRTGQEADLEQFVELGTADHGGRAEGDTGLRWRPVREPALTSLEAPAQEWEMARYRGYRAQLAGHSVEEVFGRAAAFLELTATNTRSIADVGAHPAR